LRWGGTYGDNGKRGREEGMEIIEKELGEGMEIIEKEVGEGMEIIEKVEERKGMGI